MTVKFPFKNEIISGLLMGLAQQPLGLGFIAWVGLIPWFFSFKQYVTLWDGVKSFFIWGCVYHLVTIFWLALNIGTSPVVAVISLLATVIFLSVMILPGAAIMVFTRRKTANFLFAFPIVWVGIEYFRMVGALAFPWVSFANTQTQFLLPIQNAEITGILGITFWVVMVNVVIFKSVQSNLKFRICTTAFFLLPWMTGLFLYPEDISDDGALEVAIVQPNVPLSEKWEDHLISDHIDHLIQLSQPAIQDKVDLVVWPETAPPIYLLKTGKHYLRKIQSALRGSDTVILTGIPHYEQKNREIESYNSVIMFNSTEILGLYNKIQLVPMAEYVPLSDIFPSLKDLNFGQANFTQGQTCTTFPVGQWMVGSVICFESTIPQLVRRFIRAGAGVMTIVTNDGWYESAPEPQQHAKQAIFRAIESRKPILRCANTGISMIIEPSGNIRTSSRLNEEIVLRSHIQPNHTISFYTRWGDLFAQINLVVLAGISLFLAGRKNYA